MGLEVRSVDVDRCLDAIYDATVAPTGWRPALREMAGLFGAGFVDVCSWTHDRAHVSGLAEGLDVRDYEDVFLGHWFNRNVWGQRSPVRVAGEVLSTREMVAREDLTRSVMYHEYLHARGLHEGLRLTLWVDAEGLGDMSLLRPWSAGAFGPAEVALGRALLPHLGRAAAVTRRLRRAEFRLDAGEGGAGEIAAIAFDAAGRPCWCNAAAEAVLARGELLRRVGSTLAAATPDVSARLNAAVARASGGGGASRTAGSLSLPRVGDRGDVTAVVQPLSNRNDWSMPRPPTALLMFRDPAAIARRGGALQALFGLTAAETQLALDLLGGLTLHEAARRRGRSRNTLRTHLTRLMGKTGTSRQVDLVRLLGDVAALEGPAPDPTADPFRAPRAARSRPGYGTTRPLPR